MAKSHSLHLHEQFMLIALRDEKGTITPNDTKLQYVLGASLLAELLLQQRIRIEDVKKKKLVDLVSAAPLREPLLDECLDKLAQAKRRASLKTWVSRFGRLKRLKHRTAEQLCRRGILRVDQDKVLLIFNRRIYPELDPRPERELVKALRQAIFTESEDVDPRITVLISLAHQADTLKNVFPKKELQQRKARIKRLVAGELTAAVAKEVADAIAAAVVVAVVVPSIASSAGGR